MAISLTEIESLTFFSKSFIQTIAETSSIVDIPKNQILIKENQYLKVLPLVLDGVIKVYSKYDDRELLLYYIESSQSCVMSFYAALKNTPSKIFASTETDSKLLLLPIELLPKWLKDYPELNSLFYDLYNDRYINLLDTIGHLLVDKLDKRIFDYLQKKITLINKNIIKISHARIANELGTSREVVTRSLKKLELENKIKTTPLGIELL
jgi:CRP/FNR family transcriptional regulator, anaerobic regulatory protein